MLEPLNGTKTHPLTQHAFDVLEALGVRGAKPSQEVNPGVVNRLMREGFVELVDKPSPYKTHKGRSIPYLQITAAGRARLHKGVNDG